MKTWIILAALVASPALGGAQAKPAAPRRPGSAPAVPPAMPAKPLSPMSPMEPMDAADLAPMKLEMLMDLDAHGALADVGPMLMDAAPALERARMAMDVAPMLAGLDGLVADKMALAGDAMRLAADRAMLDGDRLALDGARLSTWDDRAWSREKAARSLAGLATVPPAASRAADQADSLYRDAREALNREQYDRASDLFRQIWSRTPKSGYAPDALYWNAFALYRAGGADNLRQALALLDRQAKDFPKAGTRESAATLATRIRGQLAQSGDPKAARAIESAATSGASCENDDVRVAAINALSQMDADRALPIVRRVLARRDECSAPLREKAVYVVSQHHPADADQVLLDVVKNDPSSRVRRQAVYYLGQTRSDRALAALAELVRGSDDRDVQERALYSLAENGADRGQAVLRGVAENEAATESLRSKAIYYLGQKRGGDNTGYLRALYPKLNSTRLQEQVMYALGEAGGEDNLRWLTGIALDTTQSVKVRAAALYRVNESRGSSADVLALFDQLRGREMRERALAYVAQRREPAATAKLVDVMKTDAERGTREKALYYLSQREDPAAIDQVILVAKSDADRDLRRKAVYYLGQSKDPRAMKALEDIIGQ